MLNTSEHTSTIMSSIVVLIISFGIFLIWKRCRRQPSSHPARVYVEEPAYSNHIEILTKTVPKAEREGPVGSSGEDLHDETFKGQLALCVTCVNPQGAVNLLAKGAQAL